MNANTATPVVFITGSAGGLGSALMSEFAAQNWRVAAAWHRAPLPDRPGGKLESAEIFPVRMDAANRAQVEKAVQEVLARWERIDVLINNAGATADAPVWNISDGDWERILDSNLKSAFLCSQAVTWPMCRQRGGHIINVGSFAARHGHPGQANYVAAKAGLIGLAQSLARELGSRNVRANVVLPGVMPTPMTAQLSGEQLAELASANVLRRINSIEEVARFIVFLASMQNVSGQVFQLDSRIGRWT